MQKNSPLSEIYSKYVQNKVSRQALEGLVYQFLLDNFEHCSMFQGDREKWTDFVSWLYPRLSRSIGYYKDTGASFDIYINAIVQWSYKEYRVREAEHHATEFVCWKARAEEMQVCNAEADYQVEPKEKPMLLFPLVKIKPRHIIILLLKSYYFVSDDFLDQIRLATGMSRKKLRDMIDRIHQMRLKKEENYFKLQERMHSQFYRRLAFEKRLSCAQEGTAKYEKLTMCLERANKRYRGVRKRLETIRMDATNQQVAEVLNIPRGTVDSALHSIREKMKKGAVGATTVTTVGCT